MADPATPHTEDSPHKGYRAHSVHANAQPNLTEVRAELRYAMHRKATCVGYDKFISEFLPEAVQPAPSAPIPRRSKRTRAAKANKTAKRAPALSNPFSGMSKSACKSEESMYHALTDALNKADICEGYTFVATPHKADTTDPSKQAVDCGMYPDRALKKLELGLDGAFGRMAWSEVEIAIECKTNSTRDDPFDETIDNHEPNAISRRDVLGQILSYAELVFNYQHRTCQYMILFLGQFARIVRLDRSGLFATEKFNYYKEGAKLARFLHYYSLRSAEGRGHDPTAHRLDPKSPEVARMKARVANVAASDYAGRAFKKLLDPEWPWWKLDVADEHDNNKKRSFLVGRPHFQAPGVVGRATRGYIALEDDTSKNEFVYLKDAWRVVSDKIDKEGTVLEVLRENNVPFVPTMICHGDISGQETKSQELWTRLNPGKKCHLKHHQHYRLAVKEVGKPLDEFKNGLELLTAVFCAVIAHSEAYQKGIIHRDISVGNILLYQTPKGDWEGLLNDWELAKQLVHQEEAGRQPDRTGTWQFLSVASLDTHSKTIAVPDELESFFHVILYVALRLLPHNCPDDQVPRLLHDFFDDYSAHPEERRCGGVKRSAMLLGRVNISAYVNKVVKEEGKGTAKASVNLRFIWPGNENLKYPLNEFLTTVLSWFSAYYTLQGTPTSDTGGAAPQEQQEVEKIVVNASDNVARYLSGTTRANKKTRKEPTREELEELARNLESHEAFRSALAEVIEAEWPPIDRCKDRRPEGGYAVTKEPVPKGSKRDSSAVEGVSSGRSSKRSKPS